MIHIIYIYIIINTLMLSILHDMWNDRSSSLRQNAVAFILIFVFGLFLIVISTPIDIFNYFNKGGGRSIIINLKFILFTNYFTQKLWETIEDKEEWVNQVKSIIKTKQDYKKPTFIDKTHILAASKAIAYIEKNQLLKTK